MDQNQNSWVQEDNMDTDELINKYLAKHVDMVISKQADWQSYTDPRTGKKV